MTESKRTASDFGIRRADFDAWRSPREGAANPTRMDNPVWEWLVRTGISAYQAVQEMDAPSAFEAGPTWCFERFGQSSTQMPDGRVIYIGGEHEDHYDPDFHIYNDVVVIGPNDSVSVYGYPEDVFPPTDFHSATLVGSTIYVIGNLGYARSRKGAIDHIYMLDTDSYAFTSVKTSGVLPPWLHKHTAMLSASGDFIRISRGLIDRGAGKTLVENLGTWELSLATMTWAHTEHLPWRRWEFLRSDGKRNFLWDIRQALWSARVGWELDYRKQVEQIAAGLGRAPDVRAIEDVYRPDIGHRFIGEDENEVGTYRIEIAGVIVRFVEDHVSVKMTIEGELPKSVSDPLVDGVRRKLSDLEGVEYRVEAIQPGVMTPVR
ncbi:MAG TPA: hypothetical protein VKA50_02955 [Gammaproteobacteria bacterium]|nr:hypothetical protein [Gammaproteobacteria bacterium]